MNKQRRNGPHLDLDLLSVDPYADPYAQLRSDDHAKNLSNPHPSPLNPEWDGSLASIRLQPILESKTSKVCFHHAGRLWEGIRYQGELYGLVEKYDFAYRAQAYSMTSNLLGQGISSVLTHSSEGFALWADVHSFWFQNILKNF